MFRETILFLIFCQCCDVLCLPPMFETQKFKVGIEYDHSLPMSGGSDRYRHKNNYEQFQVTVTVSAKKGYVISYMEVTATVDELGEVEFNMLRGDAGSTSMVFQLVSKHSDFLQYSYLAYGITDAEYQKISNIITLPINKGWVDTVSCILLSVLMWIKNINYLLN